ncbi:hypothetical protein CBL_08422 [Carabus blaptoides fortunei]
MSAFQRAENIKTGGGVPAVLTNDLTNNILLQIVNEKTIMGLSNTFDGDNNSIENVAEETNIIQHCLRSKGSLNTGDRIIKVKNFEDWIGTYVKNSVPGISKTRFVLFQTGHSLKSRETMTGYCSDMSLYKVGMNRKINSAPNLSYGDYYLNIKPKKLQKIAKPTARVEGPSKAIYSSHLAEQYSKLATIKLDLAEMQRDAFKEELAIKQERENIEFELKKRSLELDIELKQIQLKKMLN